MKDLPRKGLPLNLPIYRMVNMRTLARQGEYALEHNLSDTFFENGQEDQVAQQAQHTLLLSLSKADKANIHAALQKSGMQQDPLVLTTKGLVVNGNRRLAAMRDLYASDPKRFAGFAEIDCAILPADTDDDEIEYIETRLQVAPELRLDYGWVEEAIGLKRQVDRPMAWTDITQSWGQSQQALKTKLASLEAADRYLAHRGAPRRYSEIGDDGQAFTTFVTRQSSHATAAPSRIEAERYVFFALVAEKANLARGRVYNYALVIEDITKGVVNKLAATISAAPHDTARATDDLDPLAALPAAADAVSDAVLDYLRNANNSATVAAYADAVFDEMDNLKRAKKRGGQFLQTATTIHSQASSLSLAGADSKDDRAVRRAVGGLA